MTEYVLASASGLRGAFAFAVALASAIGVGVYVLLTKPRFRRAELGQGTPRRATALVLASALALPVVAVIYWTSITGFHRLTLGAHDVRLDYILPDRSVTVPYGQLVRVAGRPARKSLWRLHVHTADGRVMRSAAASRPAVAKAAEALEQRLAR